MTITSDAPTNAPEAQLSFDSQGRPLAVRHDGRIRVVEADPVHWFGRDAWWDTRHTAAVDSGDLVSVEYWRFQVRPSSKAAQRTFTLRRNPLATQWILESIDDGG